MTVPLMEMPRVRVTFEEGRRKVRAGRAGPVSADTAKHIARLDRPDNRFPSGWRFVAIARIFQRTPIYSIDSIYEHKVPPTESTLEPRAPILANP